ncbi:MAG: hypothetical protein ACOYD6_07590 [Limnochordia bacterium]
MKKLSYLLAALMVFAMAIPAAGANVDIAGTLESQIEYKKNMFPEDHEPVDPEAELQPQESQFQISTDLELDVALSKDGQVRALVDLGTIEMEEGRFESPTIDRAVIETTGPFWLGGPDFTTTIGKNLDLRYSEAIGRVKKDGIAVRDIEAGPAKIGAFLAWDDEKHYDSELEDNQPFNVMGLKADADLDGINVGATVIHADTPEREVSFVLNGGLSPMDKVEVAAAYGATWIDVAEEAAEDIYTQMLRVDAKVNAIENFPITAQLWSIDGDFEKHTRYLEARYEDDDVTKDRIDWVGSKMQDAAGQDKAGLDLGVSTVYEGFTFGASTEIDIARGENLEFGRGNTKLTAEREIALDAAAIKGGYQMTINPENELGHKVTAEVRPTVMRELEPLTLSGQFEYDKAETYYKASAVYEAPNGITLGTHFEREFQAQEGQDDRVETLRDVTVEAGIKVDF